MNRSMLGVGSFLVLGLLTTTALPAAAQDTSTTAAPDAAPPNAAPEAPLIPPAAPTRPAERCALGGHAGVPDEDAQTAAELVCREVARGRAPSDHHYRVDLDRLGNAVFLSLTDETSQASRRMRLTGIEETVEAAPRITEALLKNKDVKETQRADNLLDAETRAPLRKSGSVLFGMGVVGAYAPGVPVLAPGLELSLRYDTTHWVAHSTLRAAGQSSGSDKLSLFNWGVGARYMFGNGDLAPFAGAGVAFMAVERNSPSNTGLGAFAELGMEALRMHRNHFGLALRADAPAFMVGDEYTVPLSLTAHVTF